MTIDLYADFKSWQTLGVDNAAEDASLRQFRKAIQRRLRRNVAGRFPQKFLDLCATLVKGLMRLGVVLAQRRQNEFAQGESREALRGSLFEQIPVGHVICPVCGGRHSSTSRPAWLARLGEHGPEVIELGSGSESSHDD